MKPLTDWEVGQMIIDYSDEMSDCNEFMISHNEIYQKVQKLRRELGDILDKLGSHSFGIYSSKSEPDKIDIGDL